MQPRTSIPAALSAAALAAAVGLAPATAAAQLVAVDDSYSVDRGATLSVAPPGVLANESGGGRDPVTAVLDSPPARGSLTLNANGGFTYVHDGSAPSSDSFTYHNTNGTASSNLATVSLTVTGPVGAGPEAVNDGYTVARGGSLDIAAPGVLGNDTSSDGGPLTASLASGPTEGTLTLNADGSFSYVHGGSEAEADSFTYTASDSTGPSAPATVTILVSGGGGSGGASLVVTFADVAAVATSAEVGGAGQAGLRLLAPVSQPATVTGSAGLPATTFELEVQSQDATLAEAARAAIAGCERKALVAQARPEKYDLRVTFVLADAGQIASASEEAVRVRLPAGSLECSVVK